MKEEKITIEDLLKEHGEDVLAVTDREIFRGRTDEEVMERAKKYPNVESPFCMCLTAVMILKEMGIFDREHKITKVKNIGGGFYCDGDNYGIVFEYGPSRYVLTSRKVDEEDIIKVPLNENIKEVIDKINATCANRYVINFQPTENPSNSTKPRKF